MFIFFILLLISNNLFSAESFTSRWGYPNINLTFNGNTNWIIRNDNYYGSNSIKICKKENNTECLNIENGYLELGQIEDHWWSSLWNIIPVNNDFIRIQNKWKSNQYLHIENDYLLESGAIENGWYSAQWKRTEVINNNNQMVEYETINGDITHLYPYDGKYVSLLLLNNNYDEVIIEEILNTFDSAYKLFKEVTGRDPHLSKQQRNGRLTLAEIGDHLMPEGAGAHADTGVTGIEMRSYVFSNLYNGVQENSKYDQALFYELGRNFWFYSSEISASRDFPSANSQNANNHFVVGTGYAIFMRHWLMNKLGLKGTFNGGSLTDLEKEIKGLLTTYVWDEQYSFENTVVLNLSTSTTKSGADMFASFLFALAEQYGDEFIHKLWKEIENGKNAAKKYSSTDNFIVAASKAANKDLRDTFKTWKWPAVGAKSNEILDTLFKGNNLHIDYFYNDYPWYFGLKEGSNYSCGSGYFCQNFSGGWNSVSKIIRVRLSDNYLYWKVGNGSWYNYGVRY